MELPAISGLVGGCPGYYRRDSGADHAQDIVLGSGHLLNYIWNLRRLSGNLALNKSLINLLSKKSHRGAI